MGYRYRLGKISKLDSKKLRFLTEEGIATLFNNSDDAPYRPNSFGYSQIYEIGKYCEDYQIEKENFYKNIDVYKKYECEFYILGKEGLKQLIELFRKEISSFFNNLLVDSEEGLSSCVKLRNYVQSIDREWDNQSKFNLLPYYLDEEITDGDIVKSWKMEYAIFNLVYIYRTFDWENDYLIFSGW